MLYCCWCCPCHAVQQSWAALPPLAGSCPSGYPSALHSHLSAADSSQGPGRMVMGSAVYACLTLKPLIRLYYAHTTHVDALPVTAVTPNGLSPARLARPATPEAPNLQALHHTCVESKVIDTLGVVWHIALVFWVAQDLLVVHEPGCLRILPPCHDLGCDCLDDGLEHDTSLQGNILAQEHAVDAIRVWTPADAPTGMKVMRGVGMQSYARQCGCLEPGLLVSTSLAVPTGQVLELDCASSARLMTK